MRKGFLRSTGTAFAALCIFVLAACAAFGAETPSTAHLVHVDTASWSSDATASNASAGATLLKTNCKGGLADSKEISFSADGAAILKGFAKEQCGLPPGFVGVVDLAYTGSIDLATEATYRDAKGNINFVPIPALTDEQKLPAATPTARLILRRLISIEKERSTFIAVIGNAWVTIKYYDGDNPFLVVGTDTVNATAGFAACTADNCPPWHEVQTRLQFGRAEITRGVTGVGFPGSDGGGDVYIVAFVGKTEGGSPRVELPTRAK
jgi:hypothetical protein